MYDKVYAKWITGNHSFIENNGTTSGRMEPINILWYQFFQKGHILLNASSGWSIVLIHPEKTFSSWDNPEQLISLADPTKIDVDLLNRLHSGNRSEEYLQLFRSGELTGGIGTLYVQHDLAPKIGNPDGKEMSISNAAYIRGQKYDLLIGAMNRPTDSPNSSIRAVYALFHNGNTYERFAVDVGGE